MYECFIFHLHQTRQARIDESNISLLNWLHSFTLTPSMMIFSVTLLKYEILTNICRIYSMHFELFLSCAFLHYFHIITNSFLYFHIFKYSIILQLSICIEIKQIKQFIRCSLFIKDKSVSSMNAI